MMYSADRTTVFLKCQKTYAVRIRSGGSCDILRMLGAVPRSAHHHQLCQRRRMDSGAHRISTWTLSCLRYVIHHYIRCTTTQSSTPLAGMDSSDSMEASAHRGLGRGRAENAGQKNSGPMMSSLRDQNAVLKNAGLEIAGLENVGHGIQIRFHNPHRRTLNRHQF